MAGHHLVQALMLLSFSGLGITVLFPTVSQIKPSNPFVFLGEELIMVCSATNVSGAYMSANNKNISEEYLNRLNDTHLIYRQSIYNESQVNCSSGITYFCKLPSGGDLPGSQVVLGDYAPSQVRNIQCRYYASQSLRCSWDLGSPYKCPQHYNVSFAFSVDNNVFRECAVENKVSATCDEIYSLRGIIRIQIQVKHTKQNIYAMDTNYNTFPVNRNYITDWSINISNFEEPKKVSDFHIVNKTSRTVVLQWRHDESSLLFQVFLVPLNGTDYSFPVERNTTNQNITVDNLKPDVTYNISVRARLSRGGYWSERVSLLDTLHQEAPESGPPTVPSAYFQNSLSCGSEDGVRDAVVLWKVLPISQRNGPITSYIVKYFPRNQSEPEIQTISVLPTETHALLQHLRCDTDYVVNIYAFNVEQSKHPSTVIVPQFSSACPLDPG